MPISALSLFLAIYAMIRSRKLLSGLFLVVALVIAVPNLPTVGKMFPFQYRVAPIVFKDATVADVLQHIAKPNGGYPFWRFRVSTRALANRRVSLTLKQDSRLGEALDLLMKQADSRYEWNWHKSCGNEPSPLCASFFVSNGKVTDKSDFAVTVDRSRIIDVAAYDEEHGTIQP